MGKSLKKADLVKRSEKLAFYGIGTTSNSVFHRMQGFTSLSTSKNAKEYGRQYVDEDNQRSDVTGYNTSISYNFDRYKDNPVLDDIIRIHEEELTGSDAVREIITVDLTTVTQGSGKYYATGIRRFYTVTPDTDGSTTDCMTYTGTFKCNGVMEIVQVSSATEDFESITAGAASDIPVLNTLTATGLTLSPAFDSSVFNYTATISGSSQSITANAKTGIRLAYTVNGIRKDNLSAIPLETGTNVIVITLISEHSSANYQIIIEKK